MMGFLKPLTAEDRDAKEQRDLAKFRAKFRASSKIGGLQESRNRKASTRAPYLGSFIVSGYTVKLKPTAAAQKVKSV